MSPAAPIDLKSQYEHVASYYAATAKGRVDYPALDGDQQTDVCVVGGGFTGLSCALHLAESGVKVILLEAKRIGWGASGRNGGQLGSGQRRDQDELEAMLGRNKAHLLWSFAEEAKNLVKDRIKRHNIPCDLTPGILHAAHHPRHYPELVNYGEKLRRDYGYTEIRDIPPEEMADMLGTKRFFGGTLDTGAGHLHPLNLALGLAKACLEAGVTIHEKTPVLLYSKGRQIRVKTALGIVTADHMVLATEAYIGNLEPKLDRRIMPINNFIIATMPLGEKVARQINRDNVAVVDSRFVPNYFHMTPDHRLLFGGGETYVPWFPNDIASFVRKRLAPIYPQLTDVPIDYAWGGRVSVTLNRFPHIGKLGHNIYFAQGYCGHGVAMANFAGKIIAEAVNQTPERLDVFARLPMYPFPGGRFLRWPLMALGMAYYALRDRI